MAIPAVSESSLRFYDRLPEFYRTADAQNGYPLLKYIALIMEQVADWEALIGRLFDGELGDPVLSDDAWLDWIAQLVGVALTPGMSVAARRDAVSSASSGWRKGSKSAVADAAKTALTGTKHVEVYDHAINAAGDGGIWDVLLVTRSDETPDVPAVLAAVVEKRAKPAGVQLHHRAFSATWATVESTLPTWTLWETKTWDEIQVLGL
jgi:hypothetical protein